MTGFTTPLFFIGDTDEYFPEPMATETLPVPIPTQSPHKRSVPQDAAMREMMQRWSTAPTTAANCRAIGQPCWNHFNPSLIRTKSTDEMKASNLWKAQATIPNFNPPFYERTNLGPLPERDEKIQETLKPITAPPARPKLRRGLRTRSEARISTKPRRLQSQTISSGGWVTESDEEDETEYMEIPRKRRPTSAPIVFQREPIRSSSTSSLLTASLQGSSASLASSMKKAHQQELKRMELEKEKKMKAQENAAGALAKQMSGMKLVPDMLPSAFDSDSEQEE